MLKIRLLIFSFFVFSFCLNAQKQANFWYFGAESGIEFTTGAPSPITDGMMDSFEGCSAYSDENGNLLFYTNGGGSPVTNSVNGYRDGIIWNRNHEVVRNLADQEGGGYSATQSALFLPKPEHDSILYLFTMAHLNSQTPSQPQGRGLSYFEFNLNLNGGVGDISVADERIHMPAFEALTATQHANGTDYWVICVDENSLDFVTVLVTENGPQAPEFQPSGMASGGLATRVLKISPDGKYLGINSRIYNFDNATGAINFQESLILMDAYSFTFSPQSRYLYTTSGFFGDLVRYDLEAPNLAASMEILAPLFESIWVGLMQIGPDGNIYYLNQELSFFDEMMNGIDVIKCPDDDIPTVEKTIFKFPVDPINEIFVGLPNFADHIFHEYKFENEINFGEDTLFVCPGDPIILDAIYPDGDYVWSTGEETKIIEPVDFGMYSVTVTNFCGEVSSDSIWVVNTESSNTLDTELISICEGDEIPLNAQTQGDTYLWSTGETEASISVALEDNYSVTVLNGCAETIENFDVSVTLQPTIEIQSLSGITICPNDSLELTLIMSNVNTFEWDGGETTPSIFVSEPGLYFVLASDEMNCAQVSDEIEVIEEENCCMPEYPDAFTPGVGEENITFAPMMEGCTFSNYDLKIYSRWGELVFETDNPDLSWDGNFDGDPAASDVYVWTLKYTLQTGDGQEVTEFGDVTLLR